MKYLFIALISILQISQTNASRAVVSTKFALGYHHLAEQIFYTLGDVHMTVPAPKKNLSMGYVGVQHDELIFPDETFGIRVDSSNGEILTTNKAVRLSLVENDDDEIYFRPGASILKVLFDLSVTEDPELGPSYLQTALEQNIQELQTYGLVPPKKKTISWSSDPEKTYFDISRLAYDNRTKMVFSEEFLDTVNFLKNRIQ